MKRFIYMINLAMLLPLIIACTDRDHNELIPDNKNTEVTFAYTTAYTATKAGENIVPVVFIFRKNGTDFLYEKEIRDGWVGGKVSTQLEPDDYKFLFAASYGVNTHIVPNTFDSATSFDEIKFENLTSGEYVLPADELFLQSPSENATAVHSIVSSETIHCTLQRAVSQVIVYVKRRTLMNGNYVPYSYEDASDNIANKIRSVDMQITGNGEGCTVAGGYGSGNTFITLDATQARVDGDGFARFEGPFLFPSAFSNSLQEIVLTFHPAVNSDLLEEDKKVTLTDDLIIEPNHQLEITIWFSVSKNEPVNIEVEAESRPITNINAGDEGMWEDIYK